MGKTPRRTSRVGELNPIDLDRVAEDVGERGGEVAEVGRRVEADEIGAEHALEDAIAGRQRAEELLGGERDVEEEPDAGAGKPLAEQAGEEQELVVVHPDHVARAVVGARPRRRTPRSPRRRCPSRSPGGGSGRAGSGTAARARRSSSPRRTASPARPRAGTPTSRMAARSRSSRSCCPASRSAGAPDQPIQSPSDCSCGRMSPVARPPLLRCTSTPASVRVTVTGSRLATIRSRDIPER